VSPLTTHVLDTSTGLPAAGLRVQLDQQLHGAWQRRNEGQTNDDGRLPGLLPSGPLPTGLWRLRFDTGAWFTSRGQRAFYPWVEVVFEVSEPTRHHHVPLLLSPFGYSTYRGS
jgi:5-hydroxyisourate hydrolase